VHGRFHSRHRGRLIATSIFKIFDLGPLLGMSLKEIFAWLVCFYLKHIKCSFITTKLPVSCRNDHAELAIYNIDELVLNFQIISAIYRTNQGILCAFVFL